LLVMSVLSAAMGKVILGLIPAVSSGIHRWDRFASTLTLRCTV
jgi:hypothetical protein